MMLPPTFDSECLRLSPPSEVGDKFPVCTVSRLSCNTRVVQHKGTGQTTSKLSSTITQKFLVNNLNSEATQDKLHLCHDAAPFIKLTDNCNTWPAKYIQTYTFWLFCASFVRLYHRSVAQSSRDTSVLVIRRVIRVTDEISLLLSL